MSKIYIGADHAGFELKEKLILFLKELGHEVEDKGAHSYDPQDDYPDFIIPVAKAIANDPEQSRGIVIGKSGQGEAMCANRFKGVRATVFYGPPFQFKKLPWYKWVLLGGGGVGTFQNAEFATLKDLVKLSREHNNANVLALAGGFIDFNVAQKVIRFWLETPFPSDERHVRRIAKLDI